MTRVVGPGRGNCRAIHGPEARRFEALSGFARVRTEGGCRLRELSRKEGGLGVRSGGLEEREVARGCARWCAGGQAEVGEDLGDAMYLSFFMDFCYFVVCNGRGRPLRPWDSDPAAEQESPRPSLNQPEQLLGR